MKKLTTDEFIQKAQRVHGNKYDYSKVNYKGSLNTVTIICKIHGEFLQNPYNHLAGNNCSLCKSHPNTSTISKFITKSNNIHNFKYDYSKFIYVNNYTKGIIICPKHGEFLQHANSHLSGRGCKKCSPDLISQKNKKTLEDFVNRANKVHNNLYDYSVSNYIGCMEKIKIKCNKCNKIFWQISNDHLNGSGCPMCYGMYKSNEEFIEECKQVHGNIYDYTATKYENSCLEISITCKKHGTFVQRAYSHLAGHKCPKCTIKISKPEIEFLNHINIDNSNRQKYVCRYKVDGIKNNKIFEFLGDYWHGNLNKYLATDINQRCKLTFKQLYEKTILKFQNLKLAGFCVYYIWESDWNKWYKNKQLSFPIKKFKFNEI